MLAARHAERCAMQEAAMLRVVVMRSAHVDMIKSADAERRSERDASVEAALRSERAKKDDVPARL